MAEEASIEVKAKEMGWIPKEQYRGDPEKFIEAKDYVERGETLLPLVRADNRKLRDEISSVKQQLTQTQQLLKNSAEAIEELKNFNTEMARDRGREQRGKLIEGIADAREKGNVDEEMRLQRQVVQIDTSLEEAERRGPKEGGPKKDDSAPPPDFTKSEWWQQWTAENESWFGKDVRKTRMAHVIAAELRQDPENKNLTGKAFMDLVAEEVQKTFGDVAPPRDKVEGGRGGSGHRTENTQSYADLPAEAKAACERQGSKVVGPGRAFAKVEDWRKHYANMYFNS